MNLSGSKSRLMVTTRELMHRWELTKNCWRDAKAAEFEQTYLYPLQDTVDSAIVAIDKLDKELSKVRKDCES